MRQDDRTPEQKKTHQWLVTATDRFLSGWGLAKGGLSKCAFACRDYNEAMDAYKWITKRGDMKYVNINTGKWYPKAKHVHIYVFKGE
jgi:hypothetical protein